MLYALVGGLALVGGFIVGLAVGLLVTETSCQIVNPEDHLPGEN